MCIIYPLGFSPNRFWEIVTLPINNGNLCICIWKGNVDLFLQSGKSF